MNAVILVLQIGLCALFVYFGFLKLILPFSEIEKRVSWANDYSHGRLKFFGVLEILGGIGILVPHQFNIVPMATPIAATGLAMVMAGAAMVHLRRDEIKMILLNIFIIFLLAGIGFNTLLEVLGVNLN